MTESCPEPTEAEPIHQVEPVLPPAEEVEITTPVVETHHGSLRLTGETTP